MASLTPCPDYLAYDFNLSPLVIANVELRDSIKCVLHLFRCVGVFIA